MLRLAELSDEENDRPSEDQAEPELRVEQYKRLTIQCLLAGDYTDKPTILTIQTLILYIEAEWLTSQDAKLESSLVLSVTMRLAMGMGLHRDSSLHAGITPFQGEIRRRLWTQVHQMDILQSTWTSLPKTIQDRDYDCALPRNIFDGEFDEDTAELPPSRPMTEPTEVSYMVAKFRLMFEVGRIVELTQSRRELDPGAISKHAQELEDARMAIPHHLQIQPVGEINMEPPSLIQQRIGIDRGYQVGKCFLYRKFLHLARRNPNFMRYRDSCIDAAMILLNHQASMLLDFTTSYPNNVRRSHLATLTTYDFFVAGMVFALDLHYGLESHPIIPGSNSNSSWGPGRRPQMISALEIAIEFWRIAKEESVEAAKAHRIFSFALVKVKQALLMTGVHAETNLRGDSARNEEVEIVLSGDQLSADSSALVPEFDWVS
jgi:hypothetical protein